MALKTWGTWGVAIAAGLLTGIPLTVASIYIGAWVTGTSIKHPLTVTWLIAALHLSVPFWLVFPFIALASITIALYFHQRAQSRTQRASIADGQARLREIETQYAAEIAKFQQLGPKLHGVWNNAQTFWHMGRKGQEPAMQIGGWIDLTSADTTEKIYLLAAYINEERADIFPEITIEPNRINRSMVMLFMIPPLESDETKPFTTAIVVEDQYNRKYELPNHTFRGTPGRTQPTLVPSKTESTLHAAWLGSAAWGWASTRLVDEGFRVYMIRGEVTFLLENVKETVHITGVEIEGAKTMGVFENFDLCPDKTEKRELRLYFQGLAPEGNAFYSPELVFIDIKGNRYPTKAHQFQPLPIPERIAYDRGIKSGAP